VQVLALTGETEEMASGDAQTGKGRNG
jgi:hypothetical protein